jgi:hypothetical protein
MADNDSWMKPWVRDVRGLNNARPSAADRGDVRAGEGAHPRHDSSSGEESAQNRVPTALPGWRAAMASKAVKNGGSNATRIIRLLPALRAELRAQGVSNMPEPLLLGWISQESSGDPQTYEPGKDEIGIWQVSRDERKDMSSTEPGGPRDLRAKMLGPSGTGDVRAQLHVGVELITFYQRTLVRAGMAADAPALPQMVRFAHHTGIHQASKLVHDIAQARAGGRTSVDPATASWSEIIRWAAAHRPPAFLNAMRSADYAMMAGQEIERQATSHPHP